MVWFCSYLGCSNKIRLICFIYFTAFLSWTLQWWTGQTSWTSSGHCGICPHCPVARAMSMIIIICGLNPVACTEITLYCGNLRGFSLLSFLSDFQPVDSLERQLEDVRTYWYCFDTFQLNAFSILPPRKYWGDCWGHSNHWHDYTGRWIYYPFWTGLCPTFAVSTKTGTHFWLSPKSPYG